MKHLKLLLALALFSFLLVSCTQDSELTDASLDLTAQINVPLNEQKGKAAFDTSEKGLYHGFFTSGMAQSNGKIWINIENDGRYNALVEIDGGGAYNFVLAPQAEVNNLVYKFTNEVGSFKIDVSNPQAPVITEAELNGMVHLGTAVKVTSQRTPTTITGTFAGDLSGTWNLIANGGEIVPGLEALSEVQVTYVPAVGDPIMKMDMDFDPTLVDCFFGAPVPYTGGFDINDVSANNQISDFGGSGLTSWSLFFNGPSGGYFDTSCNPSASGTWSRDAGATTGTITITP
jgi:hypothetical protein